MTSWLEEQAREVIEKRHIRAEDLWELDWNGARLYYRIDVHALVLEHIFEDVCLIAFEHPEHLAQLVDGAHVMTELEQPLTSLFLALLHNNCRAICKVAAGLLYAIVKLVPPPANVAA